MKLTEIKDENDVIEYVTQFDYKDSRSNAISALGAMMIDQELSFEEKMSNLRLAFAFKCLKLALDGKFNDMINLSKYQDEIFYK